MRDNWIIALAVSVLVLFGCQEEQAKTRDFSSPGEYMENPAINNAVDESNMDVNLGSDPPSIAGRYRIDGSVVDSSLPSFIGTPVGSDGCLYNQTYSGRIDFAELAQDLSATAQGNYVTGSGSQFTIWQEGDASGSGCVQHNAFLLSGAKLADGDLQGEGLTVVLEASGCGAVTAGFWYKTNLTMSLECDCSGLSDLYEDCSVGCTCDHTSNCDSGCSCDPDCSCSCDTDFYCQSGCACDPDCITWSCNTSDSRIRCWSYR